MAPICFNAGRACDCDYIEVVGSGLVELFNTQESW